MLSNSLGSTTPCGTPRLDALAEHFRVVRYDTRGHGDSPVPAGPYDIDDLADDVVALLDPLGVERAHFVGLSLGGMTGMRLAARNPERVDRLVVLCTGAALHPLSAWTDRAATVRANGTAAVAEAVVERWFTPASSRPTPTSGRPTRPSSRPPRPRATPPAARSSPAWTCATTCAITAPTLAIAGADDPATPPAHLEEIADGVQDGSCSSFPRPPTSPTPSSPRPSPRRSSSTCEQS